MARLFISHSSVDDAAALALAGWLRREGFDDYFLDFDVEQGIAPGERWMAALAGAVGRCEAVLFLVSPAWLASKFCFAEFFQAKSLGKRLFGVVVQPVAMSALPETMTAEWQVCDLTTGTDLETFTVQRPPRLAATTVAFSRPGLAALAQGLSRAGLAPTTFVWPPASDPGRAPYPGLRALDEADAAVFFGRDAAIVRALDQLRRVAARGVERLFVILGASGAGKSSFLRAGLLPRLRRDPEHFVVLPPLRPERAALSGTEGLLAALQAAFAATGDAPSRGQLRDELATAPLAAMLQRLEAATRAPDAAARTVVLPLDQGEELLSADNLAETQALLQLLAGLAVPATPVRAVVLMTIRADALPRLQASEPLQALSPAFFSLPAMPPSEFRAVIEGPARRHSQTVLPLELSPELVDELVADARGADALPLLALTLEWLVRETTTASGTRIGRADYQRLGGVRGVIGKAVERALDQPAAAPPIPADAAGQARLFDHLFLLIASVDPDSGEWKRRVATRDSVRALEPGADALVSRLVEQRLLRADAQPAADGGALHEIVEVTHEALLRQWDRLERWLQAFAAELANAEALRRAAKDWERSGHDDALLVHRQGRLETAQALLADVRLRGRFEAADHDYVAACRARERSETQEREAQLQRIAEQQAARARLQRRAAVALSVAGVALAALVVWTVRQTQAVSRQTSLVLAGAAEAALERQAPESALRLALLASTDSFLHPADPAAWPVLHRTLQTHTLRRRFAHQGEGVGPVFSADGRRVLAVPDGKSAQVFDVETGAAVGAPMPLPGRYSGAAFSPDGQRVVIASADDGRREAQTRPWDARSGQPLAPWLRQPFPVFGLTFSPDGQRLAVRDFEHAQVWATTTWQPVGARVTHDNEILGLRFSPDGRHFVTFAKDQRAQLWATDSGQPVGAAMQHPSIPQTAQFSPDGQRLLTTDLDNAAHLWDAASGQPLPVAITSPVSIEHAAFSPDGRSIAVASRNKTVSIVDAATGASLNRTMYLPSAPQQLAYSADGRRLVTRAEDGVLRTFDTATGEPLAAPLSGAPDLNDVAFSADGTRVLARSSRGAFAWNAQAAVPAGGPQAIGQVNASVLLLGDARRALVYGGATGYGGDRVGPTVLDLSTGRSQPTAEFQGTPAASPGGRWVLLSDFNLGDVFSGRYDPSKFTTTLRLLDTDTAVVTPLGTGPEPGAAVHAFSADGRRLATASQRGWTVWDLATARPVATGPAMALPPLAVAVDAGGQPLRLLALDARGGLQAIDPATGQATGPTLGTGARADATLLSPAGDRAITTSIDSGVQLWDLSQGRRLQLLVTKPSASPRPVFSPDGRFILLQADSSSPLRVLHADTGTLAMELVGREPVDSAVFSGDSRFVVSGTKGRLLVWDIATGRLALPPLTHANGTLRALASPGGHGLLSITDAGALRLWTMPDRDANPLERLRDTACEALDPAARTLQVDEVRAAPLIDARRLGEALCPR